MGNAVFTPRNDFPPLAVRLLPAAGILAISHHLPYLPVAHAHGHLLALFRQPFFRRYPSGHVYLQVRRKRPNSALQAKPLRGSPKLVCYASMRDLPLLEAKCNDCGQLFGHPSLGDFAYGEALLCTVDGKHYATVDAFSEFPTRVHALVKSAGATSLWHALAALADPVAGQQLAPGVRCPHCTSSNLEYWGGRQVGIACVPQASFAAVATLSSELLAQHMALALTQAHGA